MPLTEEEKKKQAQLSQQQASKESALDAMYNENKVYLEKQKQLQMEDAYVNQELMNKYLNESLVQQGLDKSGVANLYKQQLNTNYANTRANIANQYAQDQLDLLNEYNAEKKAEQDKYQKANYDIAVDKIKNSVNKDYGFIDDDTMAALNQYLDENEYKFGSDYRSLLESQLDLYKANDEQIKAYNEGNYQLYLDDLYTKIGDSQAINDEDYDTLVEELETHKSKIGESNYKDALQTLTAYKVMGDIVEKLNSNQRLSSYDYKQIKESAESLKNEGLITNANYNSIMQGLQALRLTPEEEEAAYQKQLQESLFADEEDFIFGDMLRGNATNYINNSTDPAFEKMVRTGAAGLVKAFKDIGNKISDFFKNNIWD